MSYVNCYVDKSPKEALGLFRSRIRRVWGHAAIFPWNGLILDRSRKPAGLQSPAACALRAGGDSDPNFENCEPSPRHRARCSRPFVAGELGLRCQELVFQI